MESSALESKPPSPPPPDGGGGDAAAAQTAAAGDVSSPLLLRTQAPFGSWTSLSRRRRSRTSGSSFSIFFH